MGSSGVSPSPHWLACLCLNLSLACQILSTGFAKKAAISMARLTPLTVLDNGYYLLAMVFLVLQSIFWPIALRGYKLSVAYFYMSLSYVAILLMSWLLFAETITVFNVLGTLLIIIGVNLIMGGGRRNA